MSGSETLLEVFTSAEPISLKDILIDSYSGKDYSFELIGNLIFYMKNKEA
jgi:hypothetical protein